MGRENHRRREKRERMIERWRGSDVVMEMFGLSLEETGAHTVLWVIHYLMFLLLVCVCMSAFCTMCVCVCVFV